MWVHDCLRYPFLLRISEMSSSSMRNVFSASWKRDFLRFPCIVRIEFSNLNHILRFAMFVNARSTTSFKFPLSRSQFRFFNQNHVLCLGFYFAWMHNLLRIPLLTSIYEVRVSPIKITFSVRKCSWMNDILQFSNQFHFIWTEYSNQNLIQFCRKTWSVWTIWN